METTQHQWRDGAWDPPLPEPDGRPSLALVFGAPALLESAERLAEIRSAFPSARAVGCSTAGEVFGTTVNDDTLTCTAITFASTRVQVAHVAVAPDASAEAGAALARELANPDLRHVLVFAEGLQVNGSELARGLQAELAEGVTVTGGLAADGDRFGRTVVLADTPSEATVVAVGLSGASLRVGYGSLGGWDPFGPSRLVTASRGNQLFSLAGEPALDLYERYLGDQAAGLPASGLLFPLALRGADEEDEVVRTLLAIDRETQSITFAGDVPEGCQVRLMKANFDRLVDGAGNAAEASRASLRGSDTELALLVSCVGRKLVLKQRVEEEVESAAQILGAGATLTGFYSYGELSPLVDSPTCRLHNQTMTITTLSEGGDASAA